MEPVIKALTTSHGRSHIKVLRALTIGDFDVEDIGHQGYSIHVTAVQVGVFITPKQELIDHLIEVLELETYEDRNGNQNLSNRRALRGFTGEWSMTPGRYPVYARRDISYRGIAKSNVTKREAKFAEVYEQVEQDWAEAGSDLVTAQLDEFNEDLRMIAEDHTKRWMEYLDQIVGDIHVKDEWLQEARGDAERSAQAEIDALEAQIEELKTRSRSLKVALSDMERDLIVPALVEDMEPESAKIVHEVRAKWRGQVKGKFKNFFE